jgi:thiamine-phosphate pyrophosphorylase
LLRLADAQESTLVDRVRAIAPLVQGANAALVLDGHPDLVVRTEADGTHLAGMQALTAAIAALKPGRIVGAGGLDTRHDAMVAAEAGADYVMFGEPGADGRRLPFEAIIERIAWWAELFQPPCVGYAMTLDEVEALAAAGADFVAVGELVFGSGEPAAAARAVANRLGRG